MYAIKNNGFRLKISLKMVMFIAIIFTCTILCGASVMLFVKGERTNKATLHPSSSTPIIADSMPYTLFGNRKKPVLKQIIPSSVMSVKLPLVLKGVLASSESRRSLAILQDPSGQHSYREGEKIADLEGVYLQSVKPDEVLIRTPQGMATLLLNDKLRDNKPLKPTKETPKRDQVKYLMHYLVANPIYKDEKLAGYRFNPRTGNNIYLRTGLIPDEVVMKINGQALNDITTSEKYLEQLESLRDVQLTVLRENQLQNIYINLATIETSLDTESHEEVH